MGALLALSSPSLAAEPLITDLGIAATPDGFRLYLATSTQIYSQGLSLAGVPEGSLVPIASRRTAGTEGTGLFQTASNGTGSLLVYRDVVGGRDEARFFLNPGTTPFALAPKLIATATFASVTGGVVPGSFTVVRLAGGAQNTDLISPTGTFTSVANPLVPAQPLVDHVRGETLMTYLASGTLRAVRLLPTGAFGQELNPVAVSFGAARDWFLNNGDAHVYVSRDGTYIIYPRDGQGQPPFFGTTTIMTAASDTDSVFTVGRPENAQVFRIARDGSRKDGPVIPGGLASGQKASACGAGACVVAAIRNGKVDTFAIGRDDSTAGPNTIDLSGAATGTDGGVTDGGVAPGDEIVLKDNGCQCTSGGRSSGTAGPWTMSGLLSGLVPGLVALLGLSFVTKRKLRKGKPPHRK